MRKFEALRARAKLAVFLNNLLHRLAKRDDAGKAPDPRNLKTRWQFLPEVIAK